MKRILFALLCAMILQSVNAQEIKVKSMDVLVTDLSARTNPRQDANGVDCALVKVVVPAVKGLSFTGWVIGDVKYIPGEYDIYVPEGTKKIKFHHENFNPGEIVFSMPIESKCVYRVILEVPSTEKIYVTDCGAKMAEGSSLFSLRKYKEARGVFQSAMKSKDVTADLKPSLQSYIDQCEMCMYYDEEAKKALLKINNIKNNGGSQEDLVAAAEEAMKYINTLNDNNPSDFYKQRIEKLEKVIEDQPLEIRFTVVKWLKEVSGFTELGPMAGVEVWSYRGDDTIAPDQYKNDKKFEKMLNSNASAFAKVFVTGADGIADLKFDRKDLPKQLVFRPVGYDGRSKISFLNLKDVMRQSSGDYKKRQYRVKMYLNNTYSTTTK